MDSKIDRMEKDLKEYRRIVEENPPNKHDASNLYTEENLNVLIHEITEKKESKVNSLKSPQLLFFTFLIKRLKCFDFVQRSRN